MHPTSGKQQRHRQAARSFLGLAAAFAAAPPRPRAAGRAGAPTPRPAVALGAPSLPAPVRGPASTRRSASGGRARLLRRAQPTGERRRRRGVPTTGERRRRWPPTRRRRRGRRASGPHPRPAAGRVGADRRLGHRGPAIERPRPRAQPDAKRCGDAGHAEAHAAARRCAPSRSPATVEPARAADRADLAGLRWPGRPSTTPGQRHAAARTDADSDASSARPRAGAASRPQPSASRPSPAPRQGEPAAAARKKPRCGGRWPRPAEKAQRQTHEHGRRRRA